MRRFRLKNREKSDFRIAILISGRGSNMEAILKAVKEGKINGKVVLVLSDNPDARGLEVARNYGVKTAVVDPMTTKKGRLSETAEKKIVEIVKKHSPDLIVLAGFMRIVGKIFLDEFEGKTINIHPSLLPKYRGLETHRRVLEAGDKIHGCTVHFVDSGVDTGKPIMQAQVPVKPDDTPETLAKRVLKREHEILTKVISMFADGSIENYRDKLPIVLKWGENAWEKIG